MTEEEHLRATLAHHVVIEPVRKRQAQSISKRDQLNSGLDQLHSHQHLTEVRYQPFNKAAEAVQQDRYIKVMTFNEQVMQCEFDKAERMLRRAEKLIKKAKK